MGDNSDQFLRGLAVSSYALVMLAILIFIYMKVFVEARPTPETFPVKDCYSLYETDLAIQTLFPDNSSGKITAARIRHVTGMLAHQCK